jgi:hypothetical protein
MSTTTLTPGAVGLPASCRTAPIGPLSPPRSTNSAARSPHCYSRLLTRQGSSASLAFSAKASGSTASLRLIGAVLS